MPFTLSLLRVLVSSYPPPLVLNLEPEGSQSLVRGRTIQVRLPSASSNVSGATQQSRVCGTVGRMLECGIKQEEMARAIKELQFEVHLSGHRQSHVSSQ